MSLQNASISLIIISQKRSSSYDIGQGLTGVSESTQPSATRLVVKMPITKHLQLHKAVEYLVQDLKPLLSIHYNLVNRQRNSRPRLLDLDAFSEVADLLTHYALDLIITEWSNTKIMGLAIEAGEKEAFNFDLENSGYPLVYELPLRYSLPCKHSAAPLPLPSTVAL